MARSACADDSGGRACRAIGCGIAAGSLATAAGAQEVYPAKPIALVVPFPPGGVADIVARPVADAMSRLLNTPVVIENKAGAGGGIGMGYVAKAKPDGYTLLLALSSISIIPEADKVTGPRADVPARPVRAHRAVHRRPDGARGPRGEPVEDACRNSSPTRARARARSRYGSSGNYGTMHIPMEMFAASADVKLLHVPYTGGGPAVRRAPRRQRRRDFDGTLDGDPARQGGQGARAGVVGRPAARRAARRSDADGIGIQRDLLPVGGAVRPGRDARAGARRNCATRRAPPPPIRASSPRWRRSKRRSSISTRPSSRASGRPTRRSSPKP